MTHSMTTDEADLSDIGDPRGPQATPVRRVFVYDVDDITYQHDRPTITGAEVMAAAGISPAEGIIQVLPDGTRKSVDPTDTIHLAKQVQFKRRPRFKRG